MGVSHGPGFGLLGSVPRSLSTQPPFATQALMIIWLSLTELIPNFCLGGLCSRLWQP